MPAIKIEHEMIICDNPDCRTVIKDKRSPNCCPICDMAFDICLTDHIQSGDENGSKLLDFCSEKCAKKCRF